MTQLNNSPYKTQQGILTRNGRLGKRICEMTTINNPTQNTKLVAIMTDSCEYEATAIAGAEAAGLKYEIVPWKDLLSSQVVDVMGAIKRIVDLGATHAVVHGFLDIRYSGCEIVMRLAQSGFIAVCVGTHNRERFQSTGIPSVYGEEAAKLKKLLLNYPTIKVEAIELPTAPLQLEDGEYMVDSVTVYDHAWIPGFGRMDGVSVVDVPKNVPMTVCDGQVTLKLGRQHQYDSFCLALVRYYTHDAKGFWIAVGDCVRSEALTLHGVKPKKGE